MKSTVFSQRKYIYFTQHDSLYNCKIHAKFFFSWVLWLWFNNKVLQLCHYKQLNPTLLQDILVGEIMHDFFLKDKYFTRFDIQKKSVFSTKTWLYLYVQKKKFPSIIKIYCLMFIVCISATYLSAAMNMNDEHIR